MEAPFVSDPKLGALLCRLRHQRGGLQELGEAQVLGVRRGVEVEAHGAQSDPLTFERNLRTIEFVAEDRIAVACEVEAELVRAASNRLELPKLRGAVRGEPGSARFARLAVGRKEGALFTFRQKPRPNLVTGRGGCAFSQCVVNLVHGPAFEPGAGLPMGIGRAREEQEAGNLEIQAVHGPQALAAFGLEGGADTGPEVFTPHTAWDAQPPSGLVDDNDGGGLVENRESTYNFPTPTI